MAHEEPIVFSIGGRFLVFEPSHALTLRKRRIMCHPISPPGGPFCLSDYQACVVSEHKLAIFKRLRHFRQVSLDENRSKFLEIHSTLVHKEKERFLSSRIDELKKRNIPVNAKTMREFDVNKFRLEVNTIPDQSISALESIVLTDDELKELFTNSVDDPLMIIFRDLYTRGLYVSSGLKFGSDFLAYQGDPVRYHALYAVRHVEGNSDGSVDLTRIACNEVNSFQRLTHGANKTPLFATIRSANGVKYWTLENRVYLDASSDGSLFASIEPNLGNTNKHQRTV